MRNIIFDCDNTMGVEGCDVDDGLALLYLLGKDSINICGITTTYGNSDIETVYDNTSIMLKEIGREDINLLKGCPDRYCVQSEAVNFIVETVNANQGNISILATGSLTNLYAAWLADSKIFDKVAEIVLMGGITEPLIIKGKALNELNFSCDPSASECVLRNGKNVSVITGNNCLKAFFAKDDFNRRLVINRPAARYIREKCTYWFKTMMTAFSLDGFHNWDVVAAAYIADPSQFENYFQELSPNLASLEKGLLTDYPEAITKSMINLPTIHDLQRFTEDVYHAWLGLDFIPGLKL